jgi:DNA-binding CsgD family transcriptional regulator/N-acetylneuraminic acid mutarotase
MTYSGESLSERELEILRCLASGASNKQIADDLSISPFTVKTHLRNIYAKLGVSTRTEATTVALQQGFVSLDTPSLTLSPSHPLTPQSPLPTLQSSTIEETLPPAQPPHHWRLLSLALLAILLLVIAGLAAWQLQGGRLLPPTPTIPLFSEEPVGNTRWLASRPLPIAQTSRATAAIGLDVYQISGETAAEEPSAGMVVTDQVQVFNTADRIWRTAANKPTAVADATAAVLFGEIYVPGGRLADGEPTAIVEAYSPSQNAWRPVTPLPQPIAGGLTLSDGSFLYFFGGWNGEAYLDTAYAYDPGADSWRPLAAMPQPAAYSAGGVLPGELVVVGGRNEQGESATCQLYNPPARAWDECPPMLRPRAGAGATVLLNKLYVIGGEPGAAAAEEAAAFYGEIFDPNTQTWQVLNLPLPNATEWWQPGVTQVETRIYAQGGRVGETLLADNFVYAPFVYQTFIPAASSDEEE